MAEREIRRRQKLSCDRFVTNLEHDTYRAQTKVYKILKHIAKNVKERARIEGNIDKKKDIEHQMRGKEFGMLILSIEHNYICFPE